MQVHESLFEMQSTAVGWRSQGKLIALVPTSGALHAGHLSLIEMAKERADVVVVSIFVNPKEFGANEDYDRYPRNRAGDIETCEKAGVQAAFFPQAKDMFPSGHSTYVVEEKVSSGMCGISRPHYFRGAATAHVKLINLVRPDMVVMGMKDPQLATVIRKVMDDLHFPVDIALGPTVRGEDGLALDTRNQYLNDFQRSDATTIYKALQKGKELVDRGIRNVDRVLAEVTHHISQVRRLRVIYVVAVDRETMEPLREIEPGKSLIACAVWCDEVRLLDNILV